MSTAVIVAATSAGAAVLKALIDAAAKRYIQRLIFKAVVVTATGVVTAAVLKHGKDWVELFERRQEKTGQR